MDRTLDAVCTEQHKADKDQNDNVNMGEYSRKLCEEFIQEEIKKVDILRAVNMAGEEDKGGE